MVLLCRNLTQLSRVRDWRHLSSSKSVRENLISQLSRNQLEIFDEIKAELNYEVKYRNEYRPKVVLYWLAKLLNYEDSVVLSEEHQDFKWLSLDEARELSGFEDLKKVFTDFHCQVLNRDL